LTTLIRAAGYYRVEPFRDALACWLTVVLAGDGQTVATVEGKTSKEAFDRNGHSSTSLSSSSTT